MTSFTRTQVYLDPADHQALRRLAAARGASMTTLVREAVARYMADEIDDELPALDELLSELYADPLYEGIPPGREGFVARMRARANADAGSDTGVVDAVDREIGEALGAEHERHRRERERTRARDDDVAQAS